jgi:hypothetical protein
MSFFELSDESSIASIPISYLYNKHTIYRSSDIQQVDGTNSANRYWKILFADQSPYTNLYFSQLDNADWSTSNMYLFGLLHNNINGLTTSPTNIRSELVIEHTSMSSGKKLYACFLIAANSTTTAPPNDIDKIVNFVSSSNTEPSLIVSFSESNTIPPQTNYYYYTDTGTQNIVVVFTNPIQVQQSTLNTLQNYYDLPITKMFDINPPNNYSEGSNSLANNNSDIYIDCQPTGVSDEQIQTYSLPINSEMANSKGQLDFMKTSVNFFIFIILVGVIYITMPMLYKTIVIDIVCSSKAVTNKLGRIRSIDYFICICFAISIFLSFYYGFSSDATEYLTAGLFLFVVFILSFVLIQNNKNDGKWMECVNYKDETKKIESDFFAFLGEGSGYFLKKVVPFYSAIMIVFLILLALPYSTGNITAKAFTKSLSIAFMVFIPISMVIRLLMDKNNVRIAPAPSGSVGGAAGAVPSAGTDSGPAAGGGHPKQAHN